MNPPLDDRRDLSKYVQKLWRYTEHFLLTDNRAYAEEILPEVKALVGWIEKVTAEDERGLIPRCTLMDNEFVENGHRSGDDFWAIAALRATRIMARRIDRKDLIEQVDRIEERLHPAILKAVDRVMKEAGYVAGTFDHGTSTRNSGCGEDRDEYQYGAVKLPARARNVRIFWKTTPEKMAFNYADYLAGFRKTIPPARIPIRYFPSEEERRELWNAVVNQPWKVIGPFASPNPILIKTSRAGTPWGFALRVLNADGKPVEGLRVDPTLQPNVARVQ